MVDDLEITLAKKKRHILLDAKHSIPAILSIIAIIISLLGYIYSRKTTKLAEEAYNSQFKVFWDIQIENDKEEVHLKFINIDEGQRAHNLILVFPYSISMDYWLASQNDYEVSISQLKPQISLAIESKLNEFHEKAKQNDLFYTLVLPIGVYTRFSVAGELKEDFSIYFVTFNVLTNKHSNSHDFEFEEILFSDRFPQERFETEVFDFGMASSYLNVLWESGLKERGLLYSSISSISGADASERDK